MCPFSRITNPLKAAQYTSITRLHIITLQRAIWRLDPTAKFCNNVTDGCLTWTKSPLDTADIIREMDDITAHENRWYHDVIHKFFDGKYIKKKDGTPTETANLRTRLTFSRDDELKALVGISKTKPNEIFNDYLDQSKPSINVINHQITGLTEMRHEEKFQHLQGSWEQPTNLYFSYDMAQVPTRYHKVGNFVFWDTQAYESETQFNQIWDPGRKLMKYGCWYAAEFAPYFNKTLEELMAGYKIAVKFWRADKDDWSNDTYKHLGVEVYRNWCALVARQGPDLNASYDKIVEKFNETGWPYFKGGEERNLPQFQSFKGVVQRIQQRNVNVLVNYVLLHEVGLI